MSNKKLTPLKGVWLWCLLLAGCQSSVPPVYAGQSLLLRPGLQRSFSIPNRPAFAALGDFRVELRLSGFTNCPVDYTNIWGFGPLQFRCFLGGGTELNVQDGAASRGVVIPMTGRTDVLMRIHRRIATGTLDVEIWDTVSGGNYRLLSAAGASTTPVDVRGTSQPIGGPATAVDIAWVRWSSEMVTLGSPAPNFASGPGNLGFWRLEGNGADTGGNSMNISLPGGGGAFGATAVYPPVAVALPDAPGLASMPQILVVRAGEPAVFDALGSYSLNDDQPSLSFSWTQVDGPTQLIWKDQQGAHPSVEGTVFGQYAVRLTVTDMAGRKSQADLTFGSVATDSHDVIQPADPLVQAVFGRLMRWGAAPWPYLDDRHKALADHFGQRLMTEPNLSGQDWLTAREGTVGVSYDSAVVTGTGTNFQDDFCGGSTQPVHQIVFWYPYTGSEFGRRVYDILRCDSATQLTLTRPYRTTDTNPEINYSRMLCNGCWYNGSSNVNYYDNVLAFYSLYYRTGFTKYLTYAQTLADRWWTMPAIDEGRTCTFGDAAVHCPPPRVWSLTGILWRAHEGRSELWPGIRRLLRLAHEQNTHQLIDTREQGYQLAFLSLGVMLDPDEVERIKLRDDVLAVLQGIWQQNQNTSGAWDNFSYGFESANTSPATTVTATTGSDLMLGNGTASYWPADAKGNWILLAGDSEAYYTMPGSTSTRLLLNRPYAGRSRTAVYQMNNLVGRGTQPFTLGIAASGFSYAYTATSSPLARKFLMDTAFWLKRHGVRPSTRGLYYGRHYTPCEPDPDNAPNCVYGAATDISVIAGERYLNGEVIGALARAYAVSNGDAELRNLGDNLVAATFGRDGGPGTDSHYARELDETITYNKEKNFGFFFGFGAAAAWPATRLNLPAAPESLAALLSHPVASPATLSVIERRSGRAVPQICPTPPCSLLLNPSGLQLFRISYENGRVSGIQPVRTR